MEEYCICFGQELILFSYSKTIIPYLQQAVMRNRKQKGSAASTFVGGVATNKITKVRQKRKHSRVRHELVWHLSALLNADLLLHHNDDVETRRRKRRGRIV